MVRWQATFSLHRRGRPRSVYMNVAGLPGFEPGLAVLETAVLPLTPQAQKLLRSLGSRTSKPNFTKFGKMVLGETAVIDRS